MIVTIHRSTFLKILVDKSSDYRKVTFLQSPLFEVMNKYLYRFVSLTKDIPNSEFIKSGFCGTIEILTIPIGASPYDL